MPTQLNEKAALEILRAALGEVYQAGPRRRVRLGIGDDAALLAPFSGELVWTSDACLEGSHFLLEWLRPEDLAHKSFHAAASDIPAMGATPRAALCHLSLSSQVNAPWLRKFAEAQARVCREARTPIVGGNITFGGHLGVTTTVLGEVAPGKALKRSGAVPGDQVWLIGDVGLARAGLLLLQAGLGAGRTSRAISACLGAFRQPRAALLLGPKLLGRAHACMDVSDGLRIDAERLASASSVSLHLESQLLLDSASPALQQVADEIGESPLSMMLTGGEDYALLATGPAKRRPKWAKIIGSVASGTGLYIDQKRTK